MMSRKLPEVCEIQYGFPFDSSLFSAEGDLPLIRIRDVVRGYTETYTSEKCDVAYLVHEGDILVGMDGVFNVAKWKGEPAYLNQRVCRIIPNETIDADFLFYFIPTALKKIENETAFVTVKHLKAKQLNAVVVPDVPIEEQKKIAAQLNVITHLISLRQQQAEKLDELVKARFVEMFGDPVRNTKHWEKASLLALGSCKNGMSFHANESGIKLRCLGVGDFKNLSYIDDVEQLPFVSLAEKPSPNCFLHDGDIVFVRSNGNKALVGRCLLVYPRDTPTIYSGFCIRYRLVTEKVDPIYALHVLKADGIRQKMSGRGANIQNLNQKILAAIEMPIPPLPLQNAFATFVYEVDREKERIQRSAALLETLKRSLMQQYFG